MFRLIYRSRSLVTMSAGDINNILDAARRRNAKDDITGLLIYHDRKFLQVLEGPKDRVMACYERVHRDPRHDRVLILLQEAVQTRAFSTWFMGYANPEELSIISQQSALSIEAIQDRLEGVAKMDVPESKKQVIRQMCIFLSQFREEETVS